MDILYIDIIMLLYKPNSESLPNRYSAL